MKPSEVLSKAADLIEPEGAWTQFALAGETPMPDEGAGDEFGLYEHHPEARCWCAMGAIGRVLPDRSGEDVLGAKRAAYAFMAKVLHSSIPAFNDDPDRTQAEVVGALREAARLAWSKGR